MKDGLSGGDGYYEVYYAGTLVARFNSGGNLEINGGLTDNAGI